MGCFGIDWLIHFIIWLAIVGGIVAIFRLLLPVVLSLFGVGGDLVMRVINIIILVIIIVALCYFLLDLAHCANFR